MTPLFLHLLACGSSLDMPQAPADDAPPAPPPQEVRADREGPVDVGDMLTFVGIFEPTADVQAVLVHGDWISPRHTGVVLRDDDDDGVADLGPAGSVVSLLAAQGEAVAPSSAPLVVTPTEACEVELAVGAAGAGEAWLLLVEDAGADTLRLDDDGALVNPYGWGGPIDVTFDGWPDGTPRHDRPLAPGDTATVTFTDLDPEAVYRVALVAPDDLLDGESLAFVDADADGTADLDGAAGAAQLTALQGSAIVPTTTYPLPSDDPVDPSGVTAIQGRITVEVTGLDRGDVTVALFENTGASTHLEVDVDGLPLEPVGLAGWLNVGP